jgi:hypothetical protein
MKKINFLLIGLIIIIGLTNCKKEVNDDNVLEETEVKKMNVVIDNPIADQTYALNEVITITGSITANFDMHGYEIKLFNESNSDSLMFESFTHGHGESMNFVELWSNTVSEHSNVRVEVSALGDHEGIERETETLLIYCYSN